jgi:putrescine transport system substrate-binding protein
MRSGVFALLVSGMAAWVVAASAQASELRIFNWSNYIDPGLLKDFEAETGIKVIYDTYDSNEILETRLLAGKTGYDLVVPSATFLSRQITAGVFAKLDQTKIANLSNIWPQIAEKVAVYDPGNAYSVTYMWGTTGIGYNEAKIKARMGDAPLDSWALVYDPEIVKRFADCGVHVLDSPEDLLPSVLRYLGRDPNSKRSEDYELAAAHIAKLKPYIQKFHSSEYVNGLANGDICLAVGYSGDVKQAEKRAAEAKNNVIVRYAIPKQGAQMWFDQMAIPADAPNKQAAHAFIDFLQRPANIARASNAVAYANGNLASQPLIDKAVRDDPSVYPTPEVLAKLFTVTSPDAKLQRVITRAWTKAKTGQ